MPSRQRKLWNIGHPVKLANAKHVTYPINRVSVKARSICQPVDESDDNNFSVIELEDFHKGELWIACHYCHVNETIVWIPPASCGDLDISDHASCCEEAFFNVYTRKTILSRDLPFGYCAVSSSLTLTPFYVGKPRKWTICYMLYSDSSEHGAYWRLGDFHDGIDKYCIAPFFCDTSNDHPEEVVWCIPPAITSEPTHIVQTIDNEVISVVFVEASPYGSCSGSSCTSVGINIHPSDMEFSLPEMRRLESDLLRCQEGEVPHEFVNCCREKLSKDNFLVLRRIMAVGDKYTRCCNRSLCYHDKSVVLSCRVARLCSRIFSDIFDEALSLFMQGEIGNTATVGYDQLMPFATTVVQHWNHLVSSVLSVLCGGSLTEVPFSLDVQQNSTDCAEYLSCLMTRVFGMLSTFGDTEYRSVVDWDSTPGKLLLDSLCATFSARQHCLTAKPIDLVCDYAINPVEIVEIFDRKTITLFCMFCQLHINTSVYRDDKIISLDISSVVTTSILDSTGCKVHSHLGSVCDWWIRLLSGPLKSQSQEEIADIAGRLADRITNSMHNQLLLLESKLCEVVPSGVESEEYCWRAFNASISATSVLFFLYCTYNYQDSVTRGINIAPDSVWWRVIHCHVNALKYLHNSTTSSRIDKYGHISTSSHNCEDAGIRSLLSSPQSDPILLRYAFGLKVVEFVYEALIARGLIRTMITSSRDIIYQILEDCLESRDDYIVVLLAASSKYKAVANDERVKLSIHITNKYSAMLVKLLSECYDSDL